MTLAISLEDIQRFYTEKKISAACPVCGNTFWNLSEANSGLNWAIGSCTDSGDIPIPYQSVPVVILSCSNCQNIRMHASKPIREWLSEGSKNDGNK